MSRSRNSTASDVAPRDAAAARGPWRAAARTGPTPLASISRLSARYDARKMTMSTLPNSAGWNESGPIADPQPRPVDLRADARARSAAAAAPRRPGRSCTCRRRASGRRGSNQSVSTNATSPTTSQIACSWAITASAAVDHDPVDHREARAPPSGPRSGSSTGSARGARPPDHEPAAERDHGEQRAVGVRSRGAVPVEAEPAGA